MDEVVLVHNKKFITDDCYAHAGITSQVYTGNQLLNRDEGGWLAAHDRISVHGGTTCCLNKDRKSVV